MFTQEMVKRSTGWSRRLNWLGTIDFLCPQLNLVERIIEEHFNGLKTLGTPTSAVEVTNVSSHGVWSLAGDKELFMPFDEFPWFREAVRQIEYDERKTPREDSVDEQNVDSSWRTLLRSLTWICNLSIESIEHPERFPLIVKIRLQVTMAMKNPPHPGGVVKDCIEDLGLSVI